MVPEFEEREAATFVQVSWAEWLEMDWQEKASAIAHYRAHNLIEAHVQHAIGQYMDAESRKRTRR